MGGIHLIGGDQVRNPMFWVPPMNSESLDVGPGLCFILGQRPRGSAHMPREPTVEVGQCIGAGLHCGGGAVQGAGLHSFHTYALD